MLDPRKEIARQIQEEWRRRQSINQTSSAKNYSKGIEEGLGRALVEVDMAMRTTGTKEFAAARTVNEIVDEVRYGVIS